MFSPQAAKLVKFEFASFMHFTAEGCFNLRLQFLKTSHSSHVHPVIRKNLQVTWSEVKDREGKKLTRTFANLKE